MESVGGQVIYLHMRSFLFAGKCPKGTYVVFFGTGVGAGPSGSSESEVPTLSHVKDGLGLRYMIMVSYLHAVGIPLPVNPVRGYGSPPVDVT